MSIWDKLAVLLCIYTTIPIIIALLYKKINKHEFTEGFLYSLVSMLIMPIAMEGLGSKEFSTFISSTTDSNEHALLSIFRLVAFAVIFCLGGSSFISRVYKIVTGQELNDLENKVSEKIEEIKSQTDKIAIAVVSGSIGNAGTNKDDIISLLELINANNGLPISSFPEDKKMLLNEIITIGAAKTIIDNETFETKIVSSELGKDFLRENKITFQSKTP